jgi:hypothetical protein
MGPCRGGASDRCDRGSRCSAIDHRDGSVEPARPTCGHTGDIVVSRTLVPGSPRKLTASTYPTGSPLSGWLHRALGWCLFRLGANEAARRRYEAVLRLRGEDFTSSVRLAQIAYRLGDYAAWQRECAQARRVDPIRYAQLGHPFELYDGRGDDERDRRGPRPGEPTRATGGRTAEAEVGSDTERSGHVTRAVGLGSDDCVSDEERQRFARLGPIRPEQLAAVDLDDLVQRLHG